MFKVEKVTDDRGRVLIQDPRPALYPYMQSYEHNGKIFHRRGFFALVRLAPPELVLTEIAIKDLPLYSSDYDADYPPVARALKQSIAEVDAVLFVTPEYNRSIPGGLKNAIDWASRPWGKNSFARKPSGVIGTSPGAIGTAVGANQAAGWTFVQCSAICRRVATQTFGFDAT